MVACRGTCGDLEEAPNWEELKELVTKQWNGRSLANSSGKEVDKVRAFRETERRKKLCTGKFEHTTVNTVVLFFPYSCKASIRT